MVVDLTSDLFTRINNGSKAKLHQVIVLKNKQNIILLQLLTQLGYLQGFQILNNREINVFLAYYRNQPSIRKIKRISKLKHRVFFSVRDLANKSSLMLHQNGFFILNTTLGVLTDIEALAYKVGGEVICQVV
jgi:ribosomal protein S8